MKKLEYWYWQLRSQATPHEITTTRWLISEAEALLIDPNAVRVPGTLVVRELPETCEEKAKRQRIYDVPRSTTLWPAVAALPLIGHLFHDARLKNDANKIAAPVDAVNLNPL